MSDWTQMSGSRRLIDQTSGVLHVIGHKWEGAGIAAAKGTYRVEGVCTLEATVLSPCRMALFIQWFPNWGSGISAGA